MEYTDALQELKNVSSCDMWGELGADTAKVLLQELERLQSLTQWVRVEDGLPDNDQKILFYSQDGDIINGMYRDELWFFDTGWEYENSPVTHWMSLPLPPEGVK